MNLREMGWNLVPSFKKFMCDRPFEPYMLQALTIDTKIPAQIHVKSVEGVRGGREGSIS